MSSLTCTQLNNARTHAAVQGGVSLPQWGGIGGDRLGYDGAGRMITKRYLAGGINETTKAYNNPSSLVGATTSYDRAGNKLFERHLEAEDRSQLYLPINSDGSLGIGYDSANRLLQYQRGVLNGDVTPFLVPAGASIDIPTTLPGTDRARTYNLDGLGNWKGTNYTEVESEGGTTSTVETRSHNYVNEITSTTDNGGTPTPFTYDKNGNLLNDGIRSYQYDALNRLVQVKKVEGNVVIGAYIYDGLNRRIQKTVSNGGLTGDITNGVSTYLYDAQQIVMDRDDEGGWVQAYFWGPYVDELLFLAKPTETVPTTYRVLSDLLFRSTALVDTSNNIVEAYDCDAYGNTLCYSGPGIDGLWFTDDDVTTNNPINTTIFTGRQYDPESQIYYYRARYYCPQWGRFIGRDPLVDAERTQGPNLYSFGSNTPCNRLDPFGMSGIGGGVVGSGQLTYNSCTGASSINGWIWAGVGYEVGKTWVGPSFYISGDLADWTWPPLWTCGKCKSCCTDAEAQGLHFAATGFNLGTPVVSGGVIFTPGKCDGTLEGIVLINVLNFIPAAAAILRIASILGVQVQAGVQVNVDVHLCVGENGGIVTDNASISGGLYIEVGNGPGIPMIPK